MSLLVATAGIVGLACGSDGGSGSGSDAGTMGSLDRARTIADELVEKGGHMTVSERATDGGIETSGGGELFDSTGSGATCTETARGACLVLACKGLLSRGISAMVSAGTNVNAGRIDITSSSGATRALELDGERGFYTPRAGAPGSGVGGAADVVAAGGTVPGFTASVAVPPSLVVSAPAVTAGLADFVVRIGEPLPIAFSGGGEADVEILLGQTAVSTLPHSRIRCVVPASSGGMTVPAEVMSLMSRFSTFQLAVAAVVDREVSAGGFRVLVRGSAPGVFLRGSFVK